MRLSLLLLFVVIVTAQTPAFEVASIRPSAATITPVPLCNNSTSNPETTLASSVTVLGALVASACQDDVDTFDLPTWARSRFALNVSIPPTTSVSLCRQMLRNLLIERFHMITAVETREVSRYFVKVAKSGLKLKPVSAPHSDPNTSVTMTSENGRLRFIFKSAPASTVFMTVQAAIARDSLARRLDLAEPINESGLTGHYDGRFEFTPPTPGVEQFPLSHTLGEALAEQLGLTLELRAAPGRVLVIKSSDRMPTEN